MKLFSHGIEDKQLSALKEAEQAALEDFKFEVKKLEANGFHNRQAQLLSETREPGLTKYRTWQEAVKAIQVLKERRSKESMALSNEIAVPVKSPRHTALVGLPYTCSDDEFRRAWIAFEANSAGSDFQTEVKRLQAAGHTYQQAWAIASVQPKGQSAMKRWKAASEALKRL